MDFWSARDDFSTGCARGLFVFGLSATLALSVASDAHSSPHAVAVSASMREISETQSTSLQGIAGTYPCAAMTLLYIQLNAEGPDAGTYQFEGMPTAQSLAFMLDRGDGSRFDKWGAVMLRGPYSTAKFYVEVRWSRERIDAALSTINTRAQLVDEFGEPLRPSHPIERPVEILVSAREYRVLDQHGAL
jgi:hypothetical protein